MTSASPSGGPGTVTVCADRSPAGLRALRWATAEARRRALQLTVVGSDPRRARRSAFADALAAVRAVVPGAGSGDESLPATLRRLSAGAAALVVPATLRDLETVVADAYCPVITVPAHDLAPEAVHGPVVLGAASWTAEDVVGLAFQEASDRNAPLRAVQVWSEPRIDLGWLHPDRIAAWDCAEERARRELELALSVWRIIYPDVRVETMVVQDRPTDFLAALSHRAQLLVVDRSTRGALLTGIAGSAVDTLLRVARCPVLVVPAHGLPRTAWPPPAHRGGARAVRRPVTTPARSR